MNDTSAHLPSIRHALESADAPSGPAVFYIQSNIGNSSWVVTRTGNVVRLAKKSGALSQLWRREDDPRGGCFLINVETDLALQWNGRGALCTLVPKDIGEPHQLWVPSDWGNWKILYAVNWNQALNVLGYTWDEKNGIGLWEFSNGQPNELWQLNAEQGAITTESITYDMSQAKVNLDVPPVRNVSTSVDNLAGSIPMTTNVRLQREVVTSRQFSYSESSRETLRTLMTMGWSSNIGDIVTVSGSIATETTVEKAITFGKTETQITTDKDVVKVEVQVPAHSKFAYAIRVFYGKVSVPYTAVVSRVLPQGGKETREIKGIFTNVNMVNYDILTIDLSKGTPPASVERLSQAGVPEPA